MITVFTPTYNRGYILKELYNSLENQSNKNFEWLIVDDGSTDNTNDLINEFKKKSKLNIRYYYKENEGKHIAINFGIKKAKGEWFFIVDSDDILPKNSIEIIYKYCNQIENNKLFAGVAGLKSLKDGKQIGNKLKEKVIDMTSAKFRKKYFGDKAEVIKTSIMKKYPFPKINEEKFMQESVLWLSISNDGYLIRWFNEVIYKGNYIEDGLTKNGKTIAKRNPLSKSYAENHIVGSNDIIMKQKIKSSINYYRYGIYGGKTYKELFKKSNSKILSLFSIPISIIYKIK